MAKRKRLLAIPVYNSAGQQVEIPRVLSATFCRDTWLQHDRLRKAEFSQKSKRIEHSIESGSTRYQQAWCCILHQYDSALQLQPQVREYFLYAPNEQGLASSLAYECWRRWEKKIRPGEVRFDDPVTDYPKLEDVIFAYPIDDKVFSDAWAHVAKMDQSKVRKAGDPNDPFVFTTLDDSVRLFRTDDERSEFKIRL